VTTVVQLLLLPLLLLLLLLQEPPLNGSHSGTYIGSPEAFKSNRKLWTISNTTASSSVIVQEANSRRGIPRLR
jgi:hypothetical protein